VLRDKKGEGNEGDSVLDVFCFTGSFAGFCSQGICICRQAMARGWKAPFSGVRKHGACIFAKNKITLRIAQNAKVKTQNQRNIIINPS
jgi:hypothetical protein